jgi:hypothetical protein
MNSGKHLMLSVVSCALAGASMAGCATPSASEAHEPATAVAGICQNVLGLSPTERLTGGNWTGTDKLDYWTSHYRGCLASLSDSLQGARDTAVVQQAEERCRGQGLLPGSPDLALCVLQSANEHPDPAPRQATTATAHASTATAATSTAAPESSTASTAARAFAAAPGVAAGSFYFASNGEIARREQIACAALGLSPAQPQFKGCVQQLRDTFYAIDHPI